MINEVTGYQLDCDCCGEPLSCGDADHLFCHSEQTLKETAILEGWRLVDGQWLCPECVKERATMNENGEYLPHED